MSLAVDSRYATVDLIHDIANGETYLSTRVPIDLPKDPTDRYRKPRAGERPDAFAYRMWGDTFGDDAAKLWWIIFDLPDNGLLNPLAPLDASKSLRIPSAERIVLEVFS